MSKEMGCNNMASISLLQWNERLHNIEESHAIFLFRIKKSSPCKTRYTHDHNHKSEDYFAYVFDSVKLTTPDSTEWVVSKAMEGLKLLSHESTTTTVRRDISAYLFRYFKINRDDLERRPRIVIVVDLHVSRAVTRGVLSRADNRLQLKSTWRFKCVSGDLRVQEMNKIRGVLMGLLNEPIVLWVRPLVSYERTGIYQIQQQLDCNDGELDVDDACSVC